MQSSMFQRIVQAQQDYQEELLRKANVVGVAAGLKNQTADGEPSIVVLVQQKKPIAALSAADEIPPEINGVRTDVMEVGYLQAQNSQNPRARFRPFITGGVSIAHYKVTAGTLGAIVYDPNTGEKFILSNNHVLANSNEAFVGDNILQPGPTDGGNNPQDVVARLERFIPLHYVEGDVNPPAQPTPDPSPSPTPRPVDPGSPTAPRSGCDAVEVLVSVSNLLAGLMGSEKRVQSASVQEVNAASQRASAQTSTTAQVVTNAVDAALARPINPNAFSDDILEIGTLTGSRPPTIGQRVRKFGRTTGFTTSTVNLLNATVNVAYNTSKGTRTARFTGQVITGAMSQGGDSGSVIVDGTDNVAVGLLFGGSPVATIFTPIDVVLNALGVKFMPPEA